MAVFVHHARIWHVQTSRGTYRCLCEAETAQRKRVSIRKKVVAMRDGDYSEAGSTRTSPALIRTPLISAENTWSITIDVSRFALRRAGMVLSIMMRNG